MTSQTARVLLFRPSGKDLQQRVRQAAANSNVLLENALAAEICRRGMSDIEVERFLRRGVVMGEPQPGTGDGGWQCEVKEMDRHRRLQDVSSVTVELYSGEVWVIKIKWISS